MIREDSDMENAAKIISVSGATSGTDSLPAVFGGEVNTHILWETVVGQRSKQRAGNASTKSRGEVSGSTRKIYKQKGTGNARHGSIRPPQFVGGGRAHGPRPHSHEKRVLKKVKKGALRSAINARAVEGEFYLIEDMQMDVPKTAVLATMLKAMGSRGVLFVGAKSDVAFRKSVSNLKNAHFVAAEGLNVYDVLKYQSVVVSRQIMPKIEEKVS